VPKTTITIDAWKCLRCDYVWPDKRENKPLRCAGCGSPYWDIPITNKIKEEKEDGTLIN
jgi:predicted Zn-ribbon and HTH transcriptional regulator